VNPEIPPLPLTVTADSAGGRLDRFVADRLKDLSRSRIQSLIRDGAVTLNGKASRASEILRGGDEIAVTLPPPEPETRVEAQDIALSVLYEDAHLIVVNKPAGLVVHPGAGVPDGTLVNALLHHCTDLSGIGGVERPGIVHRLDKETSGCLVVAKSDVIHAALSKQFASREITKVYLAVTAGHPRRSSGTIEYPIDRHPIHRKKMAVAREGHGREAVTDYRLLALRPGQALIECRPRTGRTHQIRVHLKEIGCPVAGDLLYGTRGDYSRHLLHAWQLTFVHPSTGARLALAAPPPPEFLWPDVRLEPEGEAGRARPLR